MVDIKFEEYEEFPGNFKVLRGKKLLGIIEGDDDNNKYIFNLHAVSEPFLSEELFAISVKIDALNMEIENDS